MNDQQKYLREIQAIVCHKCIDSDGKGNCLLSRDTECAMKLFFPQIVEAVRSTYSTSMETYERALREKVCSVCAHQTHDGICSLRNDVECALDRYFPLLVQRIESLDHRESTGQAPTSKSERGVQ